MRDHINISGVSGSIIAAGTGARASGVVSNGAAPDTAAVHAELDKLMDELRQAAAQPEARNALRHAENLQEAIAEEEPQAADRSWTKLRTALTGLTVAANLAQIGQFVQAFVS